jgi:hypothetical protein
MKIRADYDFQLFPLVSSGHRIPARWNALHERTIVLADYPHIVPVI